jgi:hypothetical protein
LFVVALLYWDEQFRQDDHEEGFAGVCCADQQLG